MSFLKINKIALKSSTTILKSSSPLSAKTKFNHINSSNRSNENSYEKRYYSSFSMKEDPEPSKPFGFKPLIALVLVGGISAYLYKAWDNQDFMFSSKLPYQREEVEKFKKIMKEIHQDSQKESKESKESDQQQQKQHHQEEEKEEEKVEIENSTLEDNIIESIKNHEEEMKNELISLIESVQDKYVHSNDEINADEREMDSETGGGGVGSSIGDEISKLIEEHKQNEEEESLPDLLDINYGVLSIIPEAVKSAEETVENVLKKFTHINEHSGNDDGSDTTTSIIINTSDELKSHNINIENENEESLVDSLDVNYGVLSIIPEKVKSAEEKVENVLKKFEEQYLEKVEKLISENLKLKVDFDKLVDGKDEELKRVEGEIREKYRSSLDAAIEELNKDLDEKLKDMDQFIKSKVTDNQAVLQETLEKQKSNLINIFKQQAESIKQSELEKRAITQLTQCIVDLQKLLHDKSAIDGVNGKGLLVRSFKNLTDLSNYDQLIKELLSTLPEGFEKKPVVAIDTLNNQFQDIAKRLRKSQLIDPNDNSLLGKAVSELASLFIIPEKGMVQGNDYDAILARAEDHLRKNNLSYAIKEMESIQQQSSKSSTNIDNHHLSKLTSNWIEQAKERDQLENISKLLELKLELIHKQQQQIKDEQQK
ncbi:hypothetical protein ACTFIW_009252 [Dictyostelium discoideum]